MLDLPKRLFLASARRPLHDEQGFVLPLPADEVVPASELLHHTAVLIVAPPWTGKTFVSEQLHHALGSRPDLFRARLGFESLGRGAALRPPWWDDWSKGDRDACWIVDAVDEDERTGDRRTDEILNLLEELPEAARNRLHALFFCRESEVPPVFLRRIETLYGAWSPSNPGGLRRLRLAGLDRESARAFVGAEAFERVCRILAANDLGELASLPVVLEHLKGRPAEGPLDLPEIWQGVLKDLLRERPGRARPPFSRVEVEDRFEVVQWLATVLTFSGQRELRVEAAPGPGPDLETLIPSEIPGREFRILREAARDALRTAVFEPAGDGYRFAQDHVREWFAALTLRSLPLSRVRPLLTTEDGEPNLSHAGLLDLLGRVASDLDLRVWIEQACGGPAPASNTAPWTFREAVRALDKLQEQSRSSPWGLAFWQPDRLARLAAPGLGAEIARRLEGPLSTPEQELLLDVALAVGAAETVAPALRMVREPDRAPRVRALAADLLARLGDAGQIAALEPWVRSLKGEAGDSALPILALAFYRQGIWDFETTAGFALSRSGPGGDWLQSVLSEELSLDRARSLLARGLKALRSPLVRRAVELTLDQEEPAESDWSLLLPLGLDEAGSPDMVGAFARHPEARRRLFLAGLLRDPERRLEGSWRWRSGLRPEDAAWLLELVRGRGGEPAWLWEVLHHLSHAQGVSRRVRLRVRGEMEPGLLARLDREQAQWRREEKRRSRVRPQPMPEISRPIQEPPADGCWLDQTRAQEGAECVLAAAGSGRPAAPGTIPVEKVVRFLRDARYRLLRTADDLQAVVHEELRAIALDAKEHLAMLYRPLEDGKRRRLPEDALQAYLHCRLTDRLTRGTLEPRPVIVLNREPLATRNMRNDIKIEALSLDNRLLTLIVEVKWSDNKDVSTSLVEQLGRRYLKESSLTHGIYLVGWCGPSESGPEGWRDRLDEQARRFQQEEPGLRISPFLLDLSWEISQGA